MRSRRADDGVRWLLALVVLAHILVLYWPTPGDPSGVPGMDKVVHVAVFAAVAVVGRYAGVPRTWLAALLLGHAVVSEVVQHVWLPDRSGDPWDVVADVAGTVAGLLVPLPGQASRVAGRRAP